MGDVQPELQFGNQDKQSPKADWLRPEPIEEIESPLKFGKRTLSLFSNQIDEDLDLTPDVKISMGINRDSSLKLSVLQSTQNFASLIPPFIKFMESFNGIVFIDELRKTERNPQYTSLLITFVNFLSVADLCKLRLLNTYTYYASKEG